MNWELREPVFECDQYNKELKFAYWEGHRNFVYDLVAFVEPKEILELGSQYGCSLFTFCQSVKDMGLDTHISAVDAWSGDIGAEISGEVVLAQVKEIKNKYYSSIEVSLYQMYFQDAISCFDDNSIDILHIDGGHTFEDVERDFSLYLPKLKENGIILFHDTSSTIDQGSCDHWHLIKERYSSYFEFKHSMGLGVLFPKGDKWLRLMKEYHFFSRYYQLYIYKSQYIYYFNRFSQLEKLYEDRYATINEMSEMIRQRDEEIEGQAVLLNERYRAITEMSEMIRQRDEEIKEQTALLNERYRAITEMSEMIRQRDEEIKGQTILLNERYRTITEMSEMISERDENLDNQKKSIEERDNTIIRQNMLLEERYDAIKEMSEMINQRDSEITRQNKVINEQHIMLIDRYEAINEMSEMMRQRDETIKAQASLNDERFNTINEMSDMIRQRDETISGQKSLLDERFAAMEEMSDMISCRDNNISVLNTLVNENTNLLRDYQKSIWWKLYSRFQKKGNGKEL